MQSSEQPGAPAPMPPAMREGVAFVPALLFGTIAAAVGGAIWAAIVVLTNYEVGWVAWGVGALVGFAVAMGGQVKMPVLGVMAGGLALAGLLVGKILIFVFGSQTLVDEIAAEPGIMWPAAYAELVEEGEIGPEVREFFESEAEEAPEEIAADVDEATGKVLERMNSYDDSKRRAVAEELAGEYTASMPMTELLGLGLFDLLWVFLAVGTAFQIAGKP